MMKKYKNGKVVFETHMDDYMFIVLMSIVISITVITIYGMHTGIIK